MPAGPPLLSPPLLRTAASLPENLRPEDRRPESAASSPPPAGEIFRKDANIPQNIAIFVFDTARRTHAAHARRCGPHRPNPQRPATVLTHPNLHTLAERLRRVPLLTVTAAFAAGIALAERFVLPPWLLAAALLCTGTLALLFRSSACTLALVAVAGFGDAQLRRGEPAAPRNTTTLFEIAVEGIPADRGRYIRAEGRIAAWRDPLSGRWLPSGDRILLYADSLTPLAGGERLRCRGTIRPLHGGSEGYRKTMTRRGFIGTLGLSQRTLLERLPATDNDLHRAAARRIERLGIPGDAGAAVRAMTAGDRSAVTPALRATYARSGFSHLLAVSGLHTGILFLLVNGALWWLPLVRRGHIVRHLAAMLAVWCFVAAAGFPPSAVRAAAMCTALQFALASGSEHTALNALGAAASGMLLWNPAWAGDIGFRLSVLSVAAILAWGVPLCRRLRTGRKPLDAVIGAYVVGTVASLATAPLVSHTFGIVPLAGILLNPVAIALAAVVVGSGTLWLIAPLPILAPPLRFVAGHAAAGIDALARVAAELPGGTLEYTLPAAPTAAAYALFAVATLFAWSLDTKRAPQLRT